MPEFNDVSVGDRMKPILYESTETSFTSLGLGILHEALEAVVTEEVNGVYELQFTYPVTGRLFKEIKCNRKVKADNDNYPGQIFEITEISKQMSGVVAVYCQHCSYCTAYMMIEPNTPVTGKTAKQALETWKSVLVGDQKNRITINPNCDNSDTHSVTWLVSEFDNARAVLGGADGSILSLYGGEFIFNNLDITWKQRRGNESTGITIRYGKDLIDLNQEESIDETYTSVYPVARRTVKWIFRDQIQITIDTPGHYRDSTHVGLYSDRRILKVDFSDDVSDTTLIDIKAKLVNLADQYIVKNNIGIPKVCMTLSYQDLSNALLYYDIPNGAIPKIHLGDNINVYFEQLGITNTSARVVRTKWDVINERMISIDLGELKYDIADILTKVEQTNVTKSFLRRLLDELFGNEAFEGGGNSTPLRRFIEKLKSYW